MKVQYLKIRHHRGESSAVRIYHLPYFEVCGGGGGAVGSEGNSTCWLPVEWTCSSLLRLIATLGDRYYPQLLDKETGIKDPLSTFEKARCEGCKLSFIWGKMRTATWERTLQIALRNCLKEAGGIGQCRCDSGEGRVHAICIYFLQKVSANHKEQLSPWRILVLF